MSPLFAKSAAELEKMRASARILATVQNELKSVIKSGVSLVSLDRLAEKIIRAHRAIPAFKGYSGFPATICAMTNEQVVHAIPRAQTLQNGDLLSIDCGVILDGFVADAAFSLVVGGDEKNPARAHFSKVVFDALQKGCAAAKSGNFVGDIGAAIESHVVRNGFQIIKEYGGHGLGRQMHEDPFIPNYRPAKMGARLVSGMTLAIEPIVAFGGAKTKVLADDWTVVTLDGHDAIQWEHCGVVTPDGLEIFV